MAFSPPEVSSTMPNAITSQNSIDNQHSTDDHIVTNTDIEGGSGDGETGGSADGETGGSGDGDTGGAEDDLHFQPKKRQKTSKVWLEFNVIDAVNKAECKHCKSRLSILKSKSTTHLSRHLACCLKRKLNQKQQQKISLEPINENSVSMASIALTDGKFDMRKMREAIAHWILMHEHPFTIVEEEGFNMMQKRAALDWEKVSRNTIKKDCTQVYDIERKKLMAQLKNINKISVTTDLWRSTNQKIEYMVLTGHFVDSCWKLQKRVLSFVHLPPPHRGVEIADNLYKCMKDWGIENKVFTISVDNASNNDVAIRILADTFSRNKKLLCGGKLFHVRCCAHILNLMVQEGLSRIAYIIEDIHESVLFINYNEARLRAFSEIVQQLQLPHRKLVLECKTRWN
ncbi:zinc finger BED domain-containing protein RICESLEEPER 2-like [Salvia miltiorrhiza]|uniref:zinc finger BED domain-containing protein RICESLEEPER 2-like n=1 Tax=Salvia miltiorrhiza TaxID=226208 RepID=UPI0025AD48BC|nr:zinc finger BED domain-containing protein RICESLEEPER 2-like [Salvia miltiorrhiza]